MVIVEELCNSKKVKREGNTRVGINELPDEIICHILSFLPSEEAKSETSLVSRRWRNLWKLCRSFDFDGSKTKQHELITPSQFKTQIILSLRSEFEERVNNVLQSYQGFSIPELRICFDIDKNSHFHIDKWIEIALTKKVRKLRLDFAPFPKLALNSPRPSDLYYPFPCFPCSHFLTYLSLRYLNVNDEIFGSIFSNLPMLENLHISDSPLLRNAIVSASRLKQLSIISCQDIQSVEISAPNLEFFGYIGEETVVQIRNAPKLQTSVLWVPLTNGIPQGFLQLANQLVTVHLSINLDTQVINLQSIPQLTSLRTLGCDFESYHAEKSLLFLTSLIEASPFLHTFALIIYSNGGRRMGRRRMERIVEQRKVRNRHQNKRLCLKEFQMYGFSGRKTDVEILAYLLDTAIMLEKILINTETAAAQTLAQQLVENLSSSLQAEIVFENH